MPKPLTRQQREGNLDKLLDKARDHVMTPLEIYEQRVSWIYGMQKLDSTVTREEIEISLATQGIVRPTTRSAP